MALKRKKLDAICAHLKQTSAVDVHSTTLNGDLTSDDLLRNNNGVKDDTKTVICTTSITVNNNNNNNETEVTDLNEKSEPVSSSVTHDLDPPPSGNNSSASKSQECGNEGDPSLVARDVQTSPDTVHDDQKQTRPDTVHDDQKQTRPDTAPSGSCEVSEATVARSSGWAGTDGVRSPSGTETSIAATTPVSLTPPVLRMETALGSGSSRRKRKAARPRLVCQQRHVICDVDADSEEGEERAADLRASGEERAGLLGKRRDVSCEAAYSPRSPLLPAVARPSRERVARYRNPETRRSPDLATAGQPLDLSTSRSAQGVPAAAARAIPNFLFDKPHEQDDDEDDDDDSSSSLPGDSPARTNLFTAASSPTPSSSSSTSLVVNAEAKVLLDYANTTMNELLGIFGLGAGAAEAAAGHNLTTLRALAAAGSRRKAGVTPGRLVPGWAGRLVGAVLPSAGVGAQEGATSSADDSMSVSSGDGLDLSPAQPLEAYSKKTSGNITKYKFHNFQIAPAKGGEGSSIPQKITASDYNKYIKKFRNGAECGGSHCHDLGYREHYHCHDCSFKVFVKKEEMVRHYKWHKKRDESLQQGFLRFSPLDDCSIKYGPCAHNKRQTHYHCIQSGCEKVYVSTSDVQMHANFHRKDSAIIQEGFQRFRATEDCGTTMCAFYGHRTTHFHCRRSDCKFTFKNKADMEKHKSYHQKDEVLGRDGFKKFMKYEHCSFHGCRFSKVSNHIHCIRPACCYVLHSTAQLYSHKRKHERREFESLYRSFRQTQRPLVPASVPVTNSTVAGAPVAKAAIPIAALPRDIVSVTAAGAMPAGSQVLTAVPLKGIGEPMVAQTVAGGQILQPVTKIPIKLSDVVPLMLTRTGAVIWSGAQAAAVQNRVSDVGPRPLVSASQSGGMSSLCTSKDAGINTVSSGVNVNSCSMVADISDSKREDAISSSSVKALDNTGINKKSPDNTGGSSKRAPDNIGSNKNSPDNTNASSKKSLDNTGSSSRSQKLLQADVHVKREPKSEDSEDEEDKPAGAPPSLSPTVVPPSPMTFTKTTATSPLPFTNMATELQGIVKSENLNDSLSLPIPVQEANKNVEFKVKSKPSLMKSVKQDVGSSVVTSPGQVMVTSPGQVMTLLPPMKKVGAPEKRERDESWKSYLIRYTANDPCNSRCQLLYKDHYHCKILGCPVLFRSKDGVREHAKLHNLQDSLTPLVYVHYSQDQHCPSSCQHSRKVAHYHCNWTGCNHAIAEPTPTFARLEHYRIHEYAKAAAGKNYRSHSLQGPNSGSIILNTLADSGSRRRGRPPKYPRLDAPSVPKVELSQQEIRESSQASVDGEGAGAEEKIVNGFRRFDAAELCPDDMCLYRSQLHYHCGRPRCHTATNRVDILNLHAKDFHSFVNILPHFEFFDRNVNCRRTFCSNNTVNRHYHCTRARCDYSFVRHSTMAQHSKKHVTEGGSTVAPTTAGGFSLPPGMRLQPVQLLRRADGQTYIPIIPAPLPSPNGDKSVVKASGTFFPLSGLSAATVSGVGVVTSAGTPLTSALTFTLPANMVTAGGVPIMAPAASTTGEVAGLSPMPVNLLSAGMLSGSAGPVSAATAAALTVLLQQKSNCSASGVLQPSWSAMRNSMHYSLQANCGRPFCKLKKKDHYHCLECNQAFSDPARLRGHISKHGVKFRKASLAQRMSGGATATLPPPNPTAVRLLAAPQAAEMGLDLSHPREEGDTRKREDEEDEEESGREEKERVDEENGSLSSSLSLRIGTFSSAIQVTSSAMDSADMDGEDKSPAVDDEESSQSEEASLENSDDGVDSDEDEAELTPGADQGLHSSVNPTACAASPTAASRRSSRKRTVSSRHADFLSSDDSAVLAKQMKLKLSGPIPSAAPIIPLARSSPAYRSVPDGFIRFHCSNDCGHVRCAYRQTVTHYHCTRPECAYGFSDKSRILQHQSRHERLDSLMGGEFQQFRATVQCGKADCEFSEKASHFHCQKCAFVCADSSKVLAHRKYHAKLDNISNNGFQKFGAMQACGQAMCAYSRKQTHYHCMHNGCKHAVLGPAQMAPHKLKHVT